jgi:hypothetical protein
MITLDMDGLLCLVDSHHQSGTMMPSGAVHPIIPGRRKASPETMITDGA